MENQINEIEDAIMQAQLANDIDFFEKILDDNFQFITPQGKVVTKREDIDQYKSGQLKMSKVDTSERSVHFYGDMAVVRFQVIFEGLAGKYTFSSKMRMTRVCSKQTGSWKMVAGHSSEIQN